MPIPKTRPILNRVPVVGNGLAQDAATSGMGLLTEEMQARFLGHTDRTKWVRGDAISEAPPIGLIEFLQHVAAADAYKFDLLAYNCHHYLAALTARMAAAMARTAGPRMVYKQFHQAKKEYELEEAAEKVDIQKGLLQKLVDSRGFSLLHGRMLPEGVFVLGGMAKLTFDEEGKLTFNEAGGREAVHAKEDQTFLASDMDAFFDTEANEDEPEGPRKDPVCSFCHTAIRASKEKKFHCNGCGPKGKTHWLHSSCLENCMEYSHVEVDINDVYPLPGGRAHRSAVYGRWGANSNCCTGSIAGLRKLWKEQVTGSSSVPTDLRYQQDQNV